MGKFLSQKGGYHLYKNWSLLAILDIFPNPLFLRSDKKSELSFLINIPEEEVIELAVYNIKGQKVRTIYHGILPKGNHQLTWNLLNDRNRPVSNGIYLLRLNTERNNIIKKLTIVN